MTEERGVSDVTPSAEKVSCACKPGTPDDGWQERRCEPCIRAEMDAWGQVIAWGRNGDIVKRLRARSSGVDQS